MKSIFEKIIDRELSAEIIYEDGLVISIKDINPISPQHFLVIPKKKYKNIQAVSNNDIHIFSHLFSVIQKIVTQENLNEKGYRVVINNGEYGGQTIDHLHIHIIGGRALRWPPG
jgi:histidine triad (HIT) family protein